MAHTDIAPAWQHRLVSVPTKHSCTPGLLSPLQVAINSEVLVAVSNKNYAHPGGMLQMWADNVRRSGGGVQPQRCQLWSGKQLHRPSICTPGSFSKC